MLLEFAESYQGQSGFISQVPSVSQQQPPFHNERNVIKCKCTPQLMSNCHLYINCCQQQHSSFCSLDSYPLCACARAHAHTTKTCPTLNVFRDNKWLLSMMATTQRSTSATTKDYFFNRLGKKSHVKVTRRSVIKRLKVQHISKRVKFINKLYFGFPFALGFCMVL